MLNQKGFAPIILISIIGVILIGVSYYLGTKEILKTGISVLIPTPTPTPLLSPTPVPQDKIKILSIYESKNSLVVTTDIPSYARLYFWTDPKMINTSYGTGRGTEHSFSNQMIKGEGYQVLVFDKEPENGIKSTSYYFEGLKKISVSENTSTSTTCKIQGIKTKEEFLKVNTSEDLVKSFKDESFYVLNGNISMPKASDNQSIWGVSWSTGGGGAFALDDLKKTTGSKLLEEGDCVSVIYQVATGGDKVFAIISQ